MSGKRVKEYRARIGRHIVEEFKKFANTLGFSERFQLAWRLVWKRL